jgi:carbon monoxide dehydrogenase subunit G
MKSEPETERDFRDEFDNSFEVPLPPAEAWPILMDIRRIAPCVPGAELTEVVDETTYQGRISVPLGPVVLAFAGVMKLEEVDPGNHTARVTAQGTDSKDGSAHATASFRVEPAGGGSKVLMHMDLVLSGGVTHYGSAVGMIQATAAQIMTKFADNLQAQVVGRS